MTPRATDVPAILAMAPNDWEGQWMNRQQLLSRLADRGMRVVYSTGLWHGWQRHDPHWCAAPWSGDFETIDGVIVDRAPRWLLRTRRIPWLDAGAVRLGMRRLAAAARIPRQRPLVLHVFHPEFQPYAARLRGAALVYHAYDLFELAPDWTREHARQEDWLLHRADLVIATSGVTAERLRERSGREVRLLPNGVDARTFRDAADVPVPAVLAEIPPPRIGYVGSLNRKLDLALLAELATRRREWQFVLAGPLGPLDDASIECLQRCRAMPNVHLLGERSRREVPSIVSNLDVALIPYRTGPNLWTPAVYPLKLHEYLATGRPVVSTRLPALEPFAEVLSFAEGPDEWIEAIERALRDGATGAEHRRCVAVQHDWDTLAGTLASWLNEIIDRQDSGTGRAEAA